MSPVVFRRCLPRIVFACEVSRRSKELGKDLPLARHVTSCGRLEP